MEEKFEFTGKTVEEAVENALKELQITREQADIEVLEEPQTKGFLIKKTTPAKISVKKRESDSARAVDFLEGLFDLINVHASPEIVSDDDKICINLVASNSSFLIGYRGEVLDAIQCLAGAVANIGREEYKRVVVDCEQYREKRENTLTSLAEKLADKAVKYGRKVNLEPMNPFERRIIHTALSGRNDVKTESEGKEPSRYIVIVPNEIKDERPMSAERRKEFGNKNVGYGKDRYDRKDRFDRNSRRGYGDRKGRGFEKRDSGVYGKPKDKNNVTSYGTFIGKAVHKDEE